MVLGTAGNLTAAYVVVKSKKLWKKNYQLIYTSAGYCGHLGIGCHDGVVYCTGIFF